MLPKPGGTSLLSSEQLPIIGQPVPIITYPRGKPYHKETLPVTAGLFPQAQSLSKTGNPMKVPHFSIYSRYCSAFSRNSSTA